MILYGGRGGKERLGKTFWGGGGQEGYKLPMYLVGR